MKGFLMGSNVSWRLNSEGIEGASADKGKSGLMRVSTVAGWVPGG